MFDGLVDEYVISYEINWFGVFIFLFFYEMFGIVFVEVWLCGKLVIFIFVGIVLYLEKEVGISVLYDVDGIVEGI